jgi:multimeric flavodoxin WrbA
MNVFAVLGGRNPAGQTARAADALLAGVAEAGGQVERVFLPQANLERCRQCDEHGWGLCRSEGRCVIEDDFAALAEKLAAADAVVFANPVYFSDLSESLRAFVDRLRRITRHEAGKAKVADTPAVGVCVAGGGGGGAPACTLSLEKVLATCGFDVVDMIPARRQNLEMKLPILTLTGKWLATRPSS